MLSSYIPVDVHALWRLLTLSLLPDILYHLLGPTLSPFSWLFPVVPLATLLRHSCSQENVYSSYLRTSQSSPLLFSEPFLKSSKVKFNCMWLISPTPHPSLIVLNLPQKMDRWKGSQHVPGALQGPSRAILSHLRTQVKYKVLRPRDGKQQSSKQETGI